MDGGKEGKPPPKQLNQLGLFEMFIILIYWNEARMMEMLYLLILLSVLPRC